MNFKQKVRMYLGKEINEAASGRDLDKLKKFLLRANSGTASAIEMVNNGFNLQSPSANNESVITPKMKIRLGINIDESDVATVLGELGVKSLSDIVKNYTAKANSGKGSMDTTTKNAGSFAPTR